MKEVCEALKEKNVVIPHKVFVKSIESLPHNNTNPVMFLKETSDKTYIPSSKVLQKDHARMRKCYHVYKSVFDASVLKRLANGNHNN